MKSNYWVIERTDLNPNTVQIANDYLLSLKLSKKSEQTIDKYRRYIEKFCEDNLKNLEEIEPEEVYHWLTQKYGQTKTNSYNLVFDTLAGFLKLCLSEGYVEKMLIKKRWRRKPAHLLPKYLTPSEFAKVKVQMDKMSLRDKTMLSFFFATGCRLGEVVRLNWTDIDFEKRTAKVLGKGKKERNVFFDEATALLLEKYRVEHAHPDEPVFLNKFGNRFYPMGIYQIVHKAGIKSGLKRSLFPHRTRHTTATYLLARGATLEFLADLLGHDDIGTTSIYSGILLKI